ncbi:RHOMBOID-like protein 2 [Macadamia integrifolia]|uniref:RHOMBOID-like protein 2 n=1 Tax=Macadamia integrifolia TaxID=60698 RepID=UPI001C4ED27D|nr:RHOMBOID-like protein 2 [Macadamia integrifolia]
MLMGALQPKLIVKEGQRWRLLSYMWLHGGLIHLLANMMSLLFIGLHLEKEFGFLKIGLLFVLSGLADSLSSSINLESSKVSVGASGALFGLFGAMLSELIINWTIYTNKSKGVAEDKGHNSNSSEGGRRQIPTLKLLWVHHRLEDG